VHSADEAHMAQLTGADYVVLKPASVPEDVGDEWSDTTYDPLEVLLAVRKVTNEFSMQVVVTDEYIRQPGMTLNAALTAGADGIQVRPSALHGVEFRDDGVEFRHIGVEFRHIGVEFREIGVEFRDIGVELREIGVEFRAIGVEFRGKCVEFRDIGAEFRDNGVEFRDSGVESRDNMVLHYRLGV
jgi:hypothetical protein